MQLHPELIEGVDFSGHINKVSSAIVQKWSDSIRSRGDADSITVVPDENHLYRTSTSSLDTNSAMMMMRLESEQSLLLKPFVQACSNTDLAMDALLALDSVKYAGIDIWTPESIGAAYSYHAWYGESTDEGFLEAYADMHGEEMDPEDLDRVFMPSKWAETLAASGYAPPIAKKRRTNKQLRVFAASASDKDRALVTAILDVRKLAKAGRIETTNSESYNNTEPAFIFLWDEDQMLPHALDEIYEDRWNSGEGRDTQICVEIGASKGDDALVDVKAFERLAEIQMVIGKLYDAMADIF